MCFERDLIGLAAVVDNRASGQPGAACCPIAPIAESVAVGADRSDGLVTNCRSETRV